MTMTAATWQQTATDLFNQGAIGDLIDFLAPLAGQQDEAARILSRIHLFNGNENQAQALILALDPDLADPGNRACLSVARELNNDPISAQALRRSLGLRLPILHRHPQPTERNVILTLDDGPSPCSTPRILDLLAQRGVRASFFVLGRRARAHPDLMRRMAAEGHDIFSHGFDHLAFTHRPDVVQDLIRAEDILGAFRPCPHASYPLRLPFGAGWYSSAVHESVAQAFPQAVLVQWSRSFQDWTLAQRVTDPDALPATCAHVAVAVLAEKPAAGTILLLHDHPIDQPAPLAGTASLAMLQAVLDRLDQQGLKACALGMEWQCP